MRVVDLKGFVHNGVRALSQYRAQLVGVLKLSAPDPGNVAMTATHGCVVFCCRAAGVLIPGRRAVGAAPGLKGAILVRLLCGFVPAATKAKHFMRKAALLATTNQWTDSERCIAAVSSLNCSTCCSSFERLLLFTRCQAVFIVDNGKFLGVRTSHRESRLPVSERQEDTLFKRQCRSKYCKDCTHQQHHPSFWHPSPYLSLHSSHSSSSSPGTKLIYHSQTPSLFNSQQCINLCNKQESSSAHHHLSPHCYL